MKHLAKLLLATDDNGKDATLIIDCDQCGKREYRFAVEHIATLARVFTDIAEREGLMVGATERFVEVARSNNPADIKKVSARLDAEFEQFKRRRKAGDN